MTNTENFLSLTPESTLLYFLRTLFSSMVEYAVYIPDAGNVIVLNKGHLVFLVERGCADALIKSLPQLVERKIITPLNPEKIEYPQDVKAIYVSNTSSFIDNLETALYPDEPNYPEWWNAPVPFVLSSRGLLRLNDTAINMFGSGLEKMNAYELPERNEFIVRLDGLNGTRFIAFKKLKPGIFTIDDCTEDLNDAQDITWWAAVGQTWVKEIEAQGGKWQRLNEPPEKSQSFRACEWQGQLQGYLNIEMPGRKKQVTKSPKPEIKNENENQINKQETELEQEQIKITDPDDVITNIGPQAMALLAAGQTREDQGGLYF